MERERPNRLRQIEINGLYILALLLGVGAAGSLYVANENSDKIVAIVGKSSDEVTQLNRQRQVKNYLYANLAVLLASTGVLSAGAAKLMETGKRPLKNN